MIEASIPNLVAWLKIKRFSMVINVNTILNVSVNRNTVDSSGRTADTRKSESASKDLVTDKSSETKPTEVADKFSNLSDVRHEVVKEAQAKLEEGHYDDVQTARELAKTILDINS